MLFIGIYKQNIYISKILKILRSQFYWFLSYSPVKCFYINRQKIYEESFAFIYICFNDDSA